MAKYNVSLDLLVPVLLEIEAKDAEEAEDKLYEMPIPELLKLANTEGGCVAILDGSIAIESKETIERLYR